METEHRHQPISFESFWLGHVGCDRSYHQEHIDNDTDYYTNDIPHPGTVGESTSTIVISAQPSRINL
jgi:hypothetical protein